MYKHFNDENTEGYNEVQISILNQIFRERCDVFNIDPNDPDADGSTLDYLAEKTLADYDVRGVNR